MPLPTTAAPVAQAKVGDREPNQLIITTGSMAQAQKVTTLMRAKGARIKSRKNLEALNLVISVFRLTASDNPQSIIDTIGREFPKAVVDANHRYHLLNDPNALSSIKAWSLTSIGRHTGRARCIATKAIGVLDTLSATDHPALIGAKVTNQNFTGREQPANTNHGTALAVLLTGNQPSQFASLIPGSEIKVAGVFREDHNGQSTTLEFLLYGLNWLVSENVGVINLSLGGANNRVLAHAFKQAMEKNIVLVAAAGNGGSKAPPTYPAALPGVIAVTAIDAAGLLYPYANRGSYIDIAAPGVDIWAANENGTGAYQSGTSYAAAFVSAYAAVFGKPADWSTVSKDLGDTGKDNNFGWGLLRWQPCQ
ncbi:S8 family serine peptidase [Gilvimarinus agarilyticus]|uniref:S8 family serine peptidase n=1 Tax=unclassified Gilvimarinus TaxID=2642066 RepID=UPI001C0963DD|nr:MULTISPECIES: S8 family serine peptidase [unclassified Gilvimarinus]MBU2886669.1 S8 family serine peptidase [Gilvimarinus agarilyticus]MDO6571337.1 S8 family serine peptidase [Gilvimarinus sp. 2_MG-2023]MDO6746246.1 S8 family serine peptidase [Gilvimarinus sp. 1_MG-2023]